MFQHINNLDCNNFSIIFGQKILDECFDFNLKEKQYLKLLRFIKNNESWKLISKKNIKVFYYYDLKLIVDEEGNMDLEKDVVKGYYDFLNEEKRGFRLLLNKEIKKMNVNIFPGLDQLNDLRKMREIIFQKDNVKIKFLVVNHSNKDITFEMILYSDNLSNLNNIITSFIKFLEIKVEIKDKVLLNNKEKMSISVI